MALAGNAALQDTRRLQRLAAGISPSTLPALRADVAYLDAHLATVQSAGRPFWWLAARLGWLPRIGPEVRALPALVDMAAALASGGDQAMDALAPVTEVLAAEGQSDLLARAVPALAASTPRLEVVRGKLAEAEAAVGPGRWPAPSAVGGSARQGRPGAGPRPPRPGGSPASARAARGEWSAYLLAPGPEQRRVAGDRRVHQWRWYLAPREWAYYTTPPGR